MPFVYGHSLYYLPDLDGFPSVSLPQGYEYELMEQASIPGLYGTEGFRNALQYDVSHPRPDILAFLARRGGEIVGIARASRDCGSMWQIGIDVLPGYRGQELAAALVGRLTHEILSRGIVPYYGTASSNIPSQRTAHRAGLAPAWMCCYRGRFEQRLTSPTG